METARKNFSNGLLPRRMNLVILGVDATSVNVEPFLRDLLNVRASNAIIIFIIAIVPYIPIVHVEMIFHLALVVLEDGILACAELLALTVHRHTNYVGRVNLHDDTFVRIGVGIPFFVLMKTTITLNILKGSCMEARATTVIVVIVNTKTLHANGMAY